MQNIRFVAVFLIVLLGMVLSNPVEETPNSNIKPKLEGSSANEELYLEKNYDEEDDELIESVNSLGSEYPTSAVTSTLAPRLEIGAPTQSPFVDDLPHPTESQRPDPRFSHPRACGENQYLCRKASPNQEHLRCIPNSWKCNGIRDCEENDDEANCPSSGAPVQNNYFMECSANQYKCYGSAGQYINCIDNARVCDGIKDCPYEDDERNCSAAPKKPEYSRAPEYDPDYIHQPYPARETPPPASTYPAPECPKPQYDEAQIQKLEWINRCVRSCVAKA